MKDNFNTQLDCLPPKQMIQVTKLLFKTFLREHLLPVASELFIAPWTALYVEHTLHTLQQMSVFSNGVDKCDTQAHSNKSELSMQNSHASRIGLSNTAANTAGKHFYTLESHLPMLAEWFVSYGTGSNMSQHNLQQHESLSRSNIQPLHTPSRTIEARTTHTSVASMHVPTGVLSLKQCCTWANRSAIVPRLMSDVEFCR